jgi:hypothetical protein
MFQQIMKALGVFCLSLGAGLQAMALPDVPHKFALQIAALAVSSIGGACAVLAPSIVSKKD